MQHHGLGHLPQPDNFTTCGRLGIEINQYNNPLECYADETIEEMREEKVLLDHPELADRMVKQNTQVLLPVKSSLLTSLAHTEENKADLIIFTLQQHEKQQMNPIAAQRLKSNNWDPAQSSVLKAIQAQ